MAYPDEFDERDDRMDDDRPRKQRPAAFTIDSNINISIHRDLALVISQCILTYDWRQDKPNTAAIAFAKKLQADILHAGS
jgi:hypothetical protein